MCSSRFCSELFINFLPHVLFGGDATCFAYEASSSQHLFTHVLKAYRLLLLLEIRRIFFVTLEAIMVIAVLGKYGPFTVLWSGQGTFITIYTAFYSFTNVIFVLKTYAKCSPIFSNSSNILSDFYQHVKFKLFGLYLLLRYVILFVLVLV